MHVVEQVHDNAGRVEAEEAEEGEEAEEDEEDDSSCDDCGRRCGKNCVSCTGVCTCTWDRKVKGEGGRNVEGRGTLKCRSPSPKRARRDRRSEDVEDIASEGISIWVIPEPAIFVFVVELPSVFVTGELREKEGEEEEEVKEENSSNASPSPSTREERDSSC